ncbi:hypothetical protein SLEP1_g14000 [Rubroshorea leprosula]|uniref:RNase H type-1 domain-containing protein n=1 Tax=Rubroshorea leprosula TaxID=152421 RepID=A0AAV5IT96_9ROSI|nr:hypothetical protein SLEP1_g14000 [Rubroshorea leprosula]
MAFNITTTKTTVIGLAKAANLPTRAYVTFLARNGDYVEGVVGLAKGLWKLYEAKAKFGAQSSPHLGYRAYRTSVYSAEPAAPRQFATQHVTIIGLTRPRGCGQATWVPCLDGQSPQGSESSDALMCKIFPSTLHGNARTWYYSLKPYSISSYVEMVAAFATKFSNRRLIKKTTAELMRVAQREGESLKNYLNRFNDAVLEIDSFDQAVGIAAITEGLAHERFRDSLIKHPPASFEEVNDRSCNFITTEEYVLSQKPSAINDNKNTWKEEGPHKKKFKATQNRDKKQNGSQKASALTELTHLQRSYKVCDYHQDHGHTMEACHMLKSELESLARKGMLNEFIPIKDHPRFIREQRPDSQGPQGAGNKTGVGYQQPPPPLPTPTRIIDMINGGLEPGGTSSKQQKLYVREVKHQNQAQKRKLDDEGWKDQTITFTSADFDSVVRPHNDPLVTTAIINNCEVHRVLVDTESAPDIMYYHCFESLGLDPSLLQKYDGPIYGFNNQPVLVEGVLKINVAFGSGRTYVTPSVQFLVVKMASSFNIVVGKPTLTEIRAVVSQAHLCMKFPTPMGIATLRGNQEVARHCYMTSVSRPRKDKELLQLPVQQEAPTTQQVIGVELPDNRPDGEARATPMEEREELLETKQGHVRLDFGRHARHPDLSRGAQIEHQSSKENGSSEEATVRRREIAGYQRRSTEAATGWVHEESRLLRMDRQPCYDKLVEAASGNERLSLLDAYSGYHQVRMALEDKEQHTRKWSQLCSEFKSAETWKSMQIFGIEVKPEKIKAIEEMKPPRSTKDMQRSAGRIAALHKFISKSADKCLPFFKVLRITAQKDETGKPQKFNWTTKCQVAFDELKAYLNSLPLLTKAQEGEILYLYLRISDTAISSVLVREVGKQQQLVYYASKVLQGAEQKYLIVEKVALTVVVTARKLRPYFQSHPIIVMTNQPLKQILQRPECSGRLIKWAVELGEFQIAFQQRSAIRAQVLADFVVECTSNQVELNSEAETWTLYVDGSSNSKGAGAGAVLTRPDNFRSEHALKFNFEATNNVAEYEALLMGLCLAAELKVKCLQICNDSQLVVNQVNSMCEVADPILGKYVTAVSELKNHFEKFQLPKIPRAENEHADSLSKLASENSGEVKFVYIEILNEPSFQTSRVMEISINLEAPSWTDPIRAYLLNGTVPGNKQEEVKLRRKASWYTLVGDVLYKRSYSLPLLRCLTPYEAEYALREVHEGVCGSHIGAQTLAHKVLRQGYYWPNMQEDAKKFVQRCQKCQFFTHLTHQPADEVTSMIAPWLLLNGE